MSKDYFNAAAAGWDTAERIARARGIAEVILRQVPLARDAVVADYGSGTGLVAATLASHAARVIALDNAENMLAVLADKCRASGITNIETRLCDIEADEFPAAFCDVFISSLVLHHLPSSARYATAAWQALRPGGRAVVIDLDLDDGEFHTGHDKVYHPGFDRAALARIFAAAGFAEPTVATAQTIRKRGRSGVDRDFTLFILQAEKV